MKKVVIDSRKGVVLVNGKKLPRLLLRIIKGAVGKSFVVKHYRGGRIVVTRFPDMSKVMASEQQRVRRGLFREAVVYARWVIGDEERKKAFRKTLPRKKRGKVYQAAIQLYMRMQGNQKWLRKQLAVKSILRAQEERIGNRAWPTGKQHEITGNLQSAIGHGPKIIKNRLGEFERRQRVYSNRQEIMRDAGERVSAMILRNPRVLNFLTLLHAKQEYAFGFGFQ